MNLCEKNETLTKSMADHNEILHKKDMELKQLRQELHALRQQYDNLNNQYNYNYQQLLQIQSQNNPKA